MIKKSEPIWNRLSWLVRPLLILFLLADTGYSFMQHYSYVLDGDIADVVAPSASCQKVLDDPLGLGVMLRNEVYSGPNRFVVHWSMYHYFRQVPLLVQSFADPVESVFITAALAKTGIQLAIIFLLAVYISGTFRVLSTRFLSASALVASLCQTRGFNVSIGVIDPSVTYSFFYGFAFISVLILFLPFFLQHYHYKKPMNSLLMVSFVTVMGFITVFNGPLNPASCLVIVTCVGFSVLLNLRKAPLFSKLKTSLEQIPSGFIYCSLFLLVACLYSLYIGQNNADNSWATIPLSERYLRLPVGVFEILTGEKGPLLISIILFINIWLLRQNEGAKPLLDFMKCAGVASLLYLLLLPLGGYREYRPNIVRNDTFLPVSITMFLCFGWSTIRVLSTVNTNTKKWYLPVLLAFVFIFTNAEELDTNWNRCEKEGLYEISKATDSIARIKADCSIMEWNKLKDYRESELNARLFHHWKITDKMRLYYQE